tara:strand:- start:20976 stop:21944 length:969 start_codon:yes stop_codon:yes gene_type:complete
MKNILILGGEGYIGNALYEHFSKKNFKIISFDNLIYNQKNKKKNSKKYSFIKGDIRKNKDLQKINNNYDAIIFLAGLVGDPITNKYKKVSLDINEKATKKVIKQIYDKGSAKKFIFISTCSNYGMSKSKYLTENHKLKPLSPYAKSKVKIEKFILRLEKKINFNPTILRFATAFGYSNRMRYDLTVNQFTKDLFIKKYLEIYDFNTWRPYCHVKDFARLIELVILSKNTSTAYQVFNAGSNKNNFTKKKIGIKIKKIIGGKIKYLKKSQDKRNYVVDFTKVKKILKFKPKFSIEFGIKEILRKIKANNNYDNLGNYKIRTKI